MLWISQFSPNTINVADAAPPDELVKISTFTKQLLSNRKRKSPKRAETIHTAFNLDLGDEQYTPELTASLTASKDSLERLP